MTTVLLSTMIEEARKVIRKLLMQTKLGHDEVNDTPRDNDTSHLLFSVTNPPPANPVSSVK